MSQPVSNHHFTRSHVGSNHSFTFRDDDIEVLAEDGGKGPGEASSPSRSLSRTPR